MKFNRRSLELYICTDRMWLGNNSLAAQVEESIQNGTTFVQLREKDIDFDDFVRIAREIQTVCRRYDVPFVINDNVDVAIAVDADGIHIGQSDEELCFARKRLGMDKIIGVSAGNVDEAKRAQDGGADYIGVGAVFHTGTKKNIAVLPFERLCEICQSVDIPVVAIGGISEENILQLSGSGIDGVAVISAILAKENIGEATRKLRVLADEMLEIKTRI